jgi:hypothetical protein
MSLKSKRKRFVDSRPPLSDEDFLSRTSVRPEWRGFALAAREALGRVCQIPADRIYSEDDPESLAELALLDWDDMNVVIELEQLLRVPLGDPGDDFPRFLPGRFFWRKWPAPKTVGEWAGRVAEHVRSKQDEKTTS